MFQEVCQLLPTFQRIGNGLTGDGFLQICPRSQHLQQQRLQLVEQRRRAFLPQCMAVFERQVLFASLAIDGKQAVHKRDARSTLLSATWPLVCTLRASIKRLRA
jgi:hypothetical protein